MKQWGSHYRLEPSHNVSDPIKLFQKPKRMLFLIRLIYSLVYRACFRTAKGIQRTPILKDHKRVREKEPGS